MTSKRKTKKRKPKIKGCRATLELTTLTLVAIMILAYFAISLISTNVDATGEDSCDRQGGTWNKFHKCCCPSHCSYEEYRVDAGQYMDEHPECHCCFLT